MIGDFKKFTPLQKLLALIDLILNPRATNWPFLYADYSKESDLPDAPDNHIIIKSFIKDNKIHYWCIRWL